MLSQSQPQPPEFISIDLINETLKHKPLSLTYSYGERILNFFGGRSFTFKSARWDSIIIPELSRNNIELIPCNSIEKMKSVIEIAKERRLGGVSPRNLIPVNPNSRIVKGCYNSTQDNYGEQLYEQLKTNNLTTPKLRYKLVEAFTNYYSYNPGYGHNQGRLFSLHYNHIIKPCYNVFINQRLTGPIIPGCRDYFEDLLLYYHYRLPLKILQDPTIPKRFLDITLARTQNYWHFLESIYTKVHHIQYIHNLYTSYMPYIYSLPKNAFNDYGYVLYKFEHYLQSQQFVYNPNLITLEYYLHSTNCLF
jgi:hypothetical protein